MQGTVRVIPLGGMNEVGKNMIAIEYGNEFILADCGLAFPEYDTLGADLLIRDITHPRQTPKKVAGYIFSHGHEDHIGGLAYILREINAPVWTTSLTVS